MYGIVLCDIICIGFCWFISILGGVVMVVAVDPFLLFKVGSDAVDSVVFNDDQPAVVDAVIH